MSSLTKFDFFDIMTVATMVHIPKHITTVRLDEPGNKRWTSYFQIGMVKNDSPATLVDAHYTTYLPHCLY